MWPWDSGCSGLDVKDSTFTFRNGNNFFILGADDVTPALRNGGLIVFKVEDCVCGAEECVTKDELGNVDGRYAERTSGRAVLKPDIIMPGEGELAHWNSDLRSFGASKPGCETCVTSR